VLSAGGFDERLGMYLEDVELGLRLRLAGWCCRWEPRAVARHAGSGSSGGPGALIERNTLLLVARYFRPQWLPLVAYRQLAWAWHAARGGRLREHASGARMALPLLPRFVSERTEGQVPIDEVIPRRPIRGPRAGGHPSRHARATRG
jgi:GT2 family glycosyltransferase